MLLQTVTSTLDDASRESMEEVSKEWQQHKRGISTYDIGGSGTGNDSNVTLPLSQGEWDEPLGLPLCVVCHGVSRSRGAKWIVQCCDSIVFASENFADDLAF